ncbi:hypothetical protein [Burkholderia sp. LMU1-1-1.1]|uniref:hypothetical protein n=1 Tax=Burkholderia sp. LMU1-1-1.1 TaxID=3135266 RepID=UPI0034489003
MITTDIALGWKASKDYMLQSFDGDERLPHLVVELFDEKASTQGSTAELSIHTSSARVDIEELNLYDEEVDLYDKLLGWLDEAYEEAGKLWVNGDV